MERCSSHISERVSIHHCAQSSGVWILAAEIVMSICMKQLNFDLSDRPGYMIRLWSSGVWNCRAALLRGNLGFWAAYKFWNLLPSSHERTNSADPRSDGRIETPSHASDKAQCHRTAGLRDISLGNRVNVRRLPAAVRGQEGVRVLLYAPTVRRGLQANRAPHAPARFMIPAAHGDRAPSHEFLPPCSTAHARCALWISPSQ